MIRIMTACALAVCAAAALSARQAKPSTPQQTPVFRAGAHFVRVDAYPSRDGRIVADLVAADFEVLEDGKPQQIDTFEFIRFGAFTTDEERRDPNSQREAFALASDPRFRVFVLYLDAYHVNLSGSYSLRQPLVAMLQRMLGPRDLFGMLTPRQMPKDLILGRQSLMIEEQLGAGVNWIWGLEGRYEPEPEELALEACFGQGAAGLIDRRRLDKVFSDLEGLVTLLGDLRQERKNILVFSRGWQLPGIVRAAGSRYVMPPVGVSDAGKLTLGTGARGAPDRRWCEDELMRLNGLDFPQRHRDLVTEARRANVAFYPVNPSGLETPTEGLAVRKPQPFVGGMPAGGNPVERKMNEINERTDRLIELAINTDGVAIVNTNDLSTGLKKVASDLEAYYVLGYYTTNTKWDGGVRRITVRLKGSKEQVRARREYQAPTEAEMASMRAVTSAAPAAPVAGPTPERALADLTRLQPTATLLAHGAAFAGEVAVVAEIAAAAIEVGRWKAGGDVEAIVSGADGTNAGSARARIDAGGRAALLRVPVTAAGPWNVSVRLRAAGEPDQFDQITVPATAGLLGAPLAYRGTPAASSPLRPVAAFQFRRTERIRVEWPASKPLDRRQARLLGRDGKPLAVQLDAQDRESSGRPVVALDLSLAPLTAGDYIIELTVGAGAETDRKLLAIRVVR